MHVYGDDSYRRNRAVREIIAKYSKKYPDGVVQVVDFLNEKALEQLTSFIGVNSLFAKNTLIIVRSPEEGDKKLAKVLKEFHESERVIVFVISDKKLPKDFAFLYADGIGPAKAEFKGLEGMNLLKFLKADAAEKNLSVSDEQLRVIGEVYDGDTWGAVTEIERVASGGAVAEKKTAFDFIGLIRSIVGGGRLEAKLKALFVLCKYDEPAKVFNMVAAFASGRDKVRMADYDIAIKAGKFEYEEALLEYVLLS